MSVNSNNQGRAYEFACLLSLEEAIKKYRQVQIIQDEGYDAAKRAWDAVGDTKQGVFLTGAKSFIEELFKLEPLILEEDDDCLTLSIQKDAAGEKGDVRDVLMIRKNIDWEIGLSIKHNHKAVKHSRLAQTLDFGEVWFGSKCSPNYWKKVTPIFEYLEGEKLAQKKWSEIPNKQTKIYVPLLQAFIDEIKLKTKSDSTIPRKLFEYLLGYYDFYKVISLDGKKTTQLQAFNLRSSLNRNGRRSMPVVNVPKLDLPTRIVALEMKPKSSTTVEMYLDAGWSFSFRLHSAATKVETSLKFDVQFIGVPCTLFSVDCKWNK